MSESDKPVSFQSYVKTCAYVFGGVLIATSLMIYASFLPHYEAFLAMTGSATCEEVVKRTLGEDLTKPEFWATALRAMEPSLRAYEQLA